MFYILNMNFNHLPIQSITAYISYFKRMLAIKDSDVLKKFLSEAEKEYNKKQIVKQDE